MKIGTCIQKAGQELQRNPAPFIVGTLAIIVPNAFLGWLSRYTFLAGAANWLVTTLLAAGLFVMSVKAARGQPYDLSDLGAGFSRPVPFLVINIAISLGVIACGVGVFVTSFLFMYATLYAARGEDFMPALTKSKDMALAHVTESVLLALTMFGLALAGVLACGIGLFVTLPLGILTLAYALDELERPAPQFAPYGAGYP